MLINAARRTGPSYFQYWVNICVRFGNVRRVCTWQSRIQSFRQHLFAGHWPCTWSRTTDNGSRLCTAVMNVVLQRLRCRLCMCAV